MAPARGFEMNAAVKLIVGLGNPGDEYEATRHNAGQWFLEKLLKQTHGTFTHDSKRDALVARVNLFNYDCWLLFPLTYMNLSGKAVSAFMQYYQISIESLLVAHDDVDLPIGSVRLKVGGGAGGHKGLQDILARLGSPNFVRVRIGIGRPNSVSHTSVTSYVLNKPTQTQKHDIDQAIDQAIMAVPELLAGKTSKAMQMLNTKTSEK